MIVSRTFVSRFSPNRTDPAVLEAIFVQRHRLADIWLEKLRDSVLTGVKHHLLAVGPRGCGKSHLVALLVGRLRQDAAVMAQARIAWLPEDETTPSFWKFLLRILRALNAAYGDEFPIPPREKIAGATDDRRSAVLIDFLLEKLAGHTLLVVVENLDEVMRGLKEEGQKRWRAFLQEHSVATTLATTQQLSRDLSNRDRPFFNFLQVEHLKPLTADEALALLRKLAEQTEDTDLAGFLQTSTGRARVRAIRHIAGGSHRVFIILSEFATRENLNDLVAAFNDLLDELTPYYQERLRWLPDQQREIVEFLCRQTGTVPVKEIASELFLTEQTAAAQLKQLKEKHYVVASSVGRESRYELAEPLMRLCIEVKDLKLQPIPLIVEFLRIWYDQTEIEGLYKVLSPQSESREYIDAVLREFDSEAEDPVQVALDQDWELAKESRESERIRGVARDIVGTSNSASRCFEIGYTLDKIGAVEEAVDAIKRATVLDPDFGPAWLALGTYLNLLDRWSEAVEVFDRASKIKGQYAIGRTGMGAALSELGKDEDALTVFDEVIEREPDFVHAWVIKGMVLKDQGRYERALEAIDRATQLRASDSHIWHIRGECLADAQQYSEANSSFDRAIEIDPEDCRTWLQKAHSLFALDRKEDALVAACRAADLAPEEASYLAFKGILLTAVGRCRDALEVLDQALALDSECAILWYVRGAALSDLERDQDAFEAFDRATRLDTDDIDAWLHKGISRFNLGDDSLAIQDLRHTLTLDSQHNLAAEVLCRILARNGSWNEAWAVLEGPFRQTSLDPSPQRHRSQLAQFLMTIFDSTFENSLLTERVSRVVGIYAKAKRLAYLGNALVWSLDLFDADEFGAEDLDTWVSIWQKMVEQHSELALSSRLFLIGVRYLQTKDERVLLDLVQEERSILRDLFRLNDDSNDN